MLFSASSVLSSNLILLLLVALFYFLKKTNGYLCIDISFVLAYLLLCEARVAFPVEFSFTETVFFSKVLPYFTDFIYDTHEIGGISFTFVQLFIYFWIAGSLAKLLLQIHKYRNFQCWQKHFIPYDKKSLEPVLERLRRDNIRFGRITFYQLPAGVGSFYAGLLKPKIYLPAADYGQDELYYILLHELSHYQHHDLLLKAIIESICIVYWWNPLVYWLKGMIFQFIELRSDRNVSEKLTDIQICDYADCLLKSARQDEAILVGSYLQAGIHEENFSFLRLRFKLLLRKRNASKKSLSRVKNLFVSAAMLLILSLSVLLVFNSTSEIRPEDYSPSLFSMESDDVYMVKTENGYILYSNNQECGFLDELPAAEDFRIPVYDFIDEVPK